MVWYKKNARDLPWRETSDPYKIWISEVMLQQTTVNAVIPYFERWIKAFPKVESVATASREEILRCWQGLGYYERARNIHKAAKIICSDHDGQVPSDPEKLKRLPGFGAYTRGAVLSIAFDQRHPVIDANVRRVLMRYRGLEGYANNSQDQKIKEFLETILPRRNVRIFNQALMELGALICRRKPSCLVCPLQSSCLAFQKGLQDTIPSPKKRMTIEVNVAVALIEKGGRYFIQQRPSKGLFADLWEFPGGKIEKGESPREALHREIQEELNVGIQSATPLFKVIQFYTQFRARLHVFQCQLHPYPPSDGTHKWVQLKRMQQYPMPSGSVKIVNKLL